MQKSLKNILINSSEICFCLCSPSNPNATSCLLVPGPQVLISLLPSPRALAAPRQSLCRILHWPFRVTASGLSPGPLLPLFLHSLHFSCYWNAKDHPTSTNVHLQARLLIWGKWIRTQKETFVPKPLHFPANQDPKRPTKSGHILFS